MSGYAFHPEAFIDLDQIWEYIAERNLDGADRVIADRSDRKGADSWLADLRGFSRLQCDDEFADVKNTGVTNGGVENALAVRRVRHALVWIGEQEMLRAICKRSSGWSSCSSVMVPRSTENSLFEPP